MGAGESQVQNCSLETLDLMLLPPAIVAIGPGTHSPPNWKKSRHFLLPPSQGMKGTSKSWRTRIQIPTSPMRF